jgi:phosphoglycolate phosphatase
MMPFSGLIFDLDGTLIDTAPDFISSLQQQLNRHGRELPDPDQIRCGISDGSVGLVARAFGIDPSHNEFDALRSELLEIYYQNLAVDSAPFAGVQLVLDECQLRAIPWAIATNKPWRYTEPVLVALGLLAPAAAVICPDHVKVTKPDPEPILLACQQMGIAPSEAIMVGDHLRDIEAGRAAGSRTIAAGWGYLAPGEQADDWGADLTLPCSTELSRALFGG